jgi:hypothetical protein
MCCVSSSHARASRPLQAPEIERVFLEFFVALLRVDSRDFAAPTLPISEPFGISRRGGGNTLLNKQRSVVKPTKWAEMDSDLTALATCAKGC